MIAADRQQHLEDWLTESENRYRDIVARMPAAVWTARINGEILFASEQVEAITGFTAEEVVKGGAELWARHVHPADIGSLFDKWNEIYTHGEGSIESEYRFLRKDSVWIWLQQRLSLIREYKREPYIVGISTDITARRVAEDALRGSEHRYRMLVEQARDIIFSFDIEGRFTSLNPAFETITGFRVDEWIGRTFVELLEPVSLPLAMDRFRAVLAGEQVGYSDYELRTVTGECITIEATATAIEVDGVVVGSIGTARDVTRRKQADAAAARESRLAGIGQLATSVAHEFNNVLMSIMPFAELLQRRFPDDERVTNATRHIIDGVQRGREISQQVLRFARPAKPALESINVGEWLDAFGRRFQSLLGSHFEIESRIDPSDRSLSISADPALLGQVVTNVLANARDAMPSGGLVVITACRSRAEGMVDITIEDRGTGMSASVIDHIFEPLFTTKHGGSGLGLTVAYQAMKQQDGAITVESIVGVGSKFTLSFRESRVTVDSADSSRARRMLIVEDDEAVGEGLRVLLESEGFEVVVVANGSEAVPSISEFAPDIVLLDVNLPDANGIDVFEAITRMSPGLPVIFSTGHTDGRALEELRERGIPSIMKPYDVHELLAAIEHASQPR